MNLEKTPVLDDRETTRPADFKFSNDGITNNLLLKNYYKYFFQNILCNQNMKPVLLKNKICQSKDRQIYKEGFGSFAKIWKNLNNGGKVWLKNLKKILKLYRVLNKI